MRCVAEVRPADPGKVELHFTEDHVPGGKPAPLVVSAAEVETFGAASLVGREVYAWDLFSNKRVQRKVKAAVYMKAFGSSVLRARGHVSRRVGGLRGGAGRRRRQLTIS